MMFECPLEGNMTDVQCSNCYASLRHVPCPADLHNPDFVEICLGTTIKNLELEHPEWIGTFRTRAQGLIK